MLTYLRYALATFCFAASVGCLALWLGSVVRPPMCDHITLSSGFGTVYFDAYDGDFSAYTAPPKVERWEFYSYALDTAAQAHRAAKLIKDGRFRTELTAAYLPLWYPALIFALAGVAGMSLGRRFTLRSALIATTIVAGLLGMAAGM